MSLFGIPIRIHWSLLLIIGLLVVSGMMGGAGNMQVLVFQLLLFGGLLLTVIAHEFGHALLARRMGADVIDVVLWPFVAYARYRRMPDDPMRELLVAAAGPAVNLLIALGVMIWAGPTVMFRLVGSVFSVSATDAATAPDPVLMVSGLPEVIVVIGAMNLLLGLFNLLPGFPMDGGRILRAALTPKLGFLRATIVAGHVGRVVALTFIVFGAYLLVQYNDFLGLLLGVVGFYLTMMIAAELMQVQRRHNLEPFNARDGIQPDAPVVGPRTPISEALQLLQARQMRGAPVIDEHGYMVGWVGLAPLMAAGLNWPPDSPVAWLATRHAWVRPEDRLSQVFRAMLEYQVHPVPVCEPDGRYVGLITLPRLAQLLQQAQSSQSRSSAA